VEHLERLILILEEDDTNTLSDTVSVMVNHDIIHQYRVSSWMETRTTIYHCFRKDDFLFLINIVFFKFICSRIKKRWKPRIKIVTLKLC
jgi:hypothetical protein